MGNGDVLEISASELVHILGTPAELFASGGCVMLDCRPFLAFSRTHILESRNVNWNSMLRRRSKSSAVSLEWLVPDKSLLGRLRNGEFSLIVVLDEGSRTVSELKSESLASLLLSALQSEVQPCTTEICFLQEGFDGFFAMYPELCFQSPVVPLNHSVYGDSEKIISGRRTPLYDQVSTILQLQFHEK
ncbi:dual specificity protein phosphatase 2-like [Engraulis encrasicolus]|uniref:dual specificity protein phosphatase 2-like n=1 Tax=Engraulis encrasicolus TaxID=184585 RepID=UPI002FD61FA6